MADAKRAQLAHLFRRAAFGARPSELDYYYSRPYTQAVEDLLAAREFAGKATAIPTGPATGPADDPYDRPVLRAAQSRWVQVMATTSAPLVERMALFLHDHFATAFMPGDNIGANHMEAQLALFRTHALGNFKTLCKALLDDFALACWLDTVNNHKQAPNENLARELMELFTVGPGVYTETDVREAARALSGYRLVKDESPSSLTMATMGRTTYRLVFDSSVHDYGTKRILGKAGAFMPADVIDVVLDHPAAATFIARKLAESFQSATPSTALVTAVADSLRSSGWQLVPALRTLLLSYEFRSARGAIVKSPVEFVVQAVRALGRTEYDTANALAAAAGQSLFEPPTVAGWRQNDGWLGAGQLLARYNAGVTFGRLHAQAPSAGLPTGTDIDAWTDQFNALGLSTASRAAVDRYVASTERLSLLARQAGIVTLLVASPEFSLA